MENFLENLILIKLKKYFKTLNFNKVMLVFLGNNKLFYDNFSFSVLKLISWQKIKPRLNLLLCQKWHLWQKLFRTRKATK